MSDEEQIYYLACSTYPAEDKLHHFLNMVVNESVIKDCVKCGQQVYVSRDGQENMQTMNMQPVCMKCVVANEETKDVPIQLMENTKTSVTRLLGKEATEEAIKETEGMTAHQFAQSVLDKETGDDQWNCKT